MHFLQQNWVKTIWILQDCYGYRKKYNMAVYCSLQMKLRNLLLVQ